MFSRALMQFLRSSDPERTVRDHLVAAIARQTERARPTEPARPTTPSTDSIRFLLTGYSGTRNVGADLRVAEAVRHLRHLLAPDRLEFELLTIGPHGLSTELHGVTMSTADGYLPDELEQRIAVVDGVIACEGSMFKSNFSNMLALLLTGGLALSSAAGKIAIAWAAEAGHMDELLADFVESHCGAALTVARTPRSEEVLRRHRLRTALGADPAWTLRPAAPSTAERRLGDRGWDGSAPVTCVCPVNPYWYPVRPDVARAQELARSGEEASDHFGSVLFHQQSEDATARYSAYLDDLAVIVEDRRRAGDFVLLVAMEHLDGRACADLAARLTGGAPVLASDDTPGSEVVAVLRSSALLISSRYHAILTSLPALVPAVGLSTDERIPNLFAELARPDLDVPVNSEGRVELIRSAIAACTGADELPRQQGRLVAQQLRRIGEGGRAISDEIRAHHPDVVTAPRDAPWDRYLPPIGPDLEAHLEQWA